VSREALSPAGIKFAGSVSPRVATEPMFLPQSARWRPRCPSPARAFDRGRRARDRLTRADHPV